MTGKVNYNGYTSLFHFADPSKPNEFSLKLQGVALGVFEDFGKAIIENRLSCSKECFSLLSYGLNFTDVEKFKKDWLESQKKLIDVCKIDLSDEIHELITYHFSKLDSTGKIELTLRYLGKDAIFAFGKR